MKMMHYNTVANYAKLAHYYDELLADEESLIHYWLPEMIEVTKAPNVLELACGSGLFSRILEQVGYSVVATDLQEEMIGVAKKLNSKIDYFSMDMSDFELNREFDQIICICDSINYLDLQQIRSMFASVYKHLRKNGQFLFDMHHLARLNEFQHGFVEEGKLADTYYQWSIQSDKEHGMLFENFVFYEDDEITVEKHKQYVYDVYTILSILEDCGFKCIVKSEFIAQEKVLIKGVKI